MIPKESGLYRARLAAGWTLVQLIVRAEPPSAWVYAFGCGFSVDASEVTEWGARVAMPDDAIEIRYQINQCRRWEHPARRYFCIVFTNGCSGKAYGWAPLDAYGGAIADLIPELARAHGVVLPC